MASSDHAITRSWSGPFKSTVFSGIGAAALPSPAFTLILESACKKLVPDELAMLDQAWGPTSRVMWLDAQANRRDAIFQALCEIVLLQQSIR